MEKHIVPEPVVRRLPRYYRLLQQLRQEGMQTVSSNQLAQRMGTTASQVRQDLNHFGSFGYKRHGYDVQALTKAIADILGLQQDLRAVIVGAEDIGAALMQGFPFAVCGVTLTAAFSLRDEPQPGGAVPVLSFREFARYAAENQVDVVALAVSEAETAQVLETLLACPIRGIWNFTNGDLDVGGSGIPVENVHFADSLTRLSYHMAAQARQYEPRQTSYRSAVLWERSAVQRLPALQDSQYDVPQRGRFPASFAEAM